MACQRLLLLLCEIRVVLYQDAAIRKVDLNGVIRKPYDYCFVFDLLKFPDKDLLW